MPEAVSAPLPFSFSSVAADCSGSASAFPIPSSSVPSFGLPIFGLPISVVPSFGMPVGVFFGVPWGQDR